MNVNILNYLEEFSHKTLVEKMVEINLTEEKIGDFGEKYYNTNDRYTLCSKEKYKLIVVNTFEYYFSGMQWENIGEDEVTYYIYK